MIAQSQLLWVFFTVISLLLGNVCYGTDTKVGRTMTTSSPEPPTISEVIDKEDKGSEPDKTSSSFEFIPVEKIHEVIREERINTLFEIDKERKAVLAYLTQERRVVMEEIKTELNRITELLMSERRATMVEAEAMGNRIVENSIDHFFIRALQLAMIIVALMIVVFIIFRIKSRK